LENGRVQSKVGVLIPLVTVAGVHLRCTHRHWNPHKHHMLSFRSFLRSIRSSTRYISSSWIGPCICASYYSLRMVHQAA
jgi:hypothetical protein